MKFWTSGRLDERIDFDLFQPVMLEIEEKINSAIEGKYFGEAISSYDVVVNIFKTPSAEKFKYNAKTKETDIDVNLDHDIFLDGNFTIRSKMYIEAIIYSVEKIEFNKKLSEFNFDMFRLILKQILDEYIETS